MDDRRCNDCGAPVGGGDWVIEAALGWYLCTRCYAADPAGTPVTMPIPGTERAENRVDPIPVSDCTPVDVPEWVPPNYGNTAGAVLLPIAPSPPATAADRERWKREAAEAKAWRAMLRQGRPGELYGDTEAPAVALVTTSAEDAEQGRLDL